MRPEIENITFVFGGRGGRSRCVILMRIGRHWLKTGDTEHKLMPPAFIDELGDLVLALEVSGGTDHDEPTDG